jgi:hypothetical protein
LEPLSARELLRFLEDARLEEQRRARHVASLGPAELVERGLALAGCRHLETDATGRVTFACDDDASRLRRGDRVVLLRGSESLEGRLVSLSRSRAVVALRAPVEGDGWLLRVAVDPVLDAAGPLLARMDGARRGTGPAFLRALGGGASAGPLAAGDELEALEREVGYVLTDEQADAFRRGMSDWPAWALQGPPGTGKTVVAAFIAEALARRGRRVCLVAPSHEALHRLLAAVAEAFPRRRVEKFEVQRSVSDPQRARRRPRWSWPEDRRVLGMTAHAALVAAHRFGLRADHLIVDEAGQLPLSLGAALGVLAGSITLLGDVQQLPCIVPEALRASPLATSLLSRFVDANPALATSLRRSSRLSPQLARALGEVFYGGALHATREDEPAPPALAEGDAWASGVLAHPSSLLWIQTRSAEEETALTARLARVAARVERVAVVTPFRRQVRALRAVMGDDELLVDTIDRLQGQSVDVTFVSLAAPDEGESGALGPFYRDPGRWNVAFSRARRKVVALGSPEALAVRPSPHLDRLLRRATPCTPPDASERAPGPNVDMLARDS